MEVQLSSPCCDVSPESIALPVDEHLDAPKVFFVILARKLGRVPLIFSVWQDGVQIAAVTHFIQVVSASQQARPIIKTESHALSVEERELVKPAKPDSFEIPEMHLRRDGTVVVVGQRERRRIKLHGNELDLLRHLYRRSGEIVPRKTLVERVLDEVYVPGDRAQYQRLNRLIAGLRDKLELKRDKPFVVQTVRGRGYRLDARVTRFTRRGSITRSRAKRMRTDKSSDLLH